MAVYILDSNFFIEAHRVSYPLDIAFSFWNKVMGLAAEGKIISIDKVKNELFGKNDPLENWCREKLPSGFFKDKSSVITAYQQVANWAYSRRDHYNQAAIDQFLDADKADAFIVAFALFDSSERVVVTHEISNPNQRSKIKIPDAGHALGVRVIRVMDMFRELNETF